MNRSLGPRTLALALLALALPMAATAAEKPAAETFALMVHQQAALATRLAGLQPDPTAQISCTPDFFACTCSGAFDCAWLSWYCSALGGVSGFDDECYLPDLHPDGREVLAGAQALAAEVRHANTQGGRRNAALRKLAPAVRALERDLHGLALASADAVGKQPPAASIQCTPDLFHCGCDNALDCTWLSWFCSALGGVGTGDGCYLPSLGPEAERTLRLAEQLELGAELASACR